MKTLAAITIVTALILAVSTVPSYSHGVNWGVSVNLGLPVYPAYAPAYPVYPAYVYPAPVAYPVVYRAGGPRYYHGGRHCPPRPYYRHHRHGR